MLFKLFKENIVQENLFQPKDKLLLAVSGGVDSIVLCELCKQAGYDFTLAHCNFQLRGKESDRDEAFLNSLAKRYNVTLLAKKFETEKYAEEKKVSIQVAARELRYGWFGELVGSQPSLGEFTHDCRLPIADWLITAHHQDDNIETVLMNFFKGTGLAGLRGMLPKQGNLIRPLLFATKEQLMQFAIENNLQWVEDSSNQSDKYSRNYFRHHLIPVIEKIYPKAKENLADNIARFRDIEILYEESIAKELKKLVEKKGDEIHIPVLKLKKLNALKSVLYELIKKYGFSASQLGEVLHLLNSESGKYILSPSHRILKNRNWLIISPKNTEEQQHILIEQGMETVQFEKGNLLFKTASAANGQLSTVNSIASIDAEEIEFPLLLRRWTPGDYFYPLGLRKKKKLARFFIDQKLSLAEKEKAWVLEMNKKIVWVVGMRIDDRFKITEKTKRVLQISCHPLPLK